MNNYLIVLKALFKNKLRFDIGSSKRGKIALFVALGIAYAMIMFVLLSTIIEFRLLLSIPVYSMAFYFFMLITGALIVLIFGIVNLVNTLYLSKDTDFYSMLPIKSSTVFAAKLSYVYLSEAAIIAIILFPLLLTFGIVINAWVPFYIISLLTLIIVPALPLVIAAIFAIPVMYLASKLKNRNIIPLVFYIILFGGGFALYIYFAVASTNMSDDGIITEETINGIVKSIQAILYLLYPYTALSLSVLGIPSYGLSVGGSTVVNLVIFVGSSVALGCILLLLGNFMYAQSAKANNQTNEKAKKGEFKSASGLRALMKREYILSLRTTQVAFQCYATLLIPIIFAVMFSLMFGNFEDMAVDENGFMLFDVRRFSALLTFATILTMMITVNNGAATSFSREGTALSSLKILPINAKQIFKAKVLSWLVFVLPIMTIAIIIVNAINFNLDYLFLSLFSFVPLGAIFVIFGVLWDLSAPKLKWTDPRDAVKHNLHVTVGQLFGIIAGVILIILFMVLFASAVSFDIISIVFWSYIYGIAVIFAVVDILLYRKINTYYNRIEI